MAFLAKLFHRAVPTSQWLPISTELTTKFAEVRSGWFAGCVRTLEHANEAIVNGSLGSDTEITIKAYQLLTTSRFLGTKPYIALSDGAAFADLLYAQVCGDQIHQVIERVQIYDHPDIGKQTWKVGTDVASYISGERSIAGVLLSTKVLTLALITQGLVAVAFADNATALEIESKLKRLHAEA